MSKRLSFRAHNLLNQAISLGIALLLGALIALGINAYLMRSQLKQADYDTVASITRSLRLAVTSATPLKKSPVLNTIARHYVGDDQPSVMAVAIVDAKGTLLTYQSRNESRNESQQKFQATSAQATSVDVAVNQVIAQVLSSSPVGTGNSAASSHPISPNHTGSYHSNTVGGVPILIHVLPFAPSTGDAIRDAVERGAAKQSGLAIVAIDLNELRQNNRSFLLTSSAITLALMLVLATLAVLMTRKPNSLETTTPTSEADVDGSTETALQRSEKTLQSFLEALPDLVIWVSRDGVRLELSPGKVKLLSDCANWVGSTIQDMLPPPLARQRLQVVQQALETQELQVYEYQIEIDGKVQYEEARVVAGGEDEAIVIVRDISDRKRAEIALRESEVTNRALIQTIPDMLIRMKLDGTCLSIHNGGSIDCVNPVQAVPGSNLYEVLPPELASQRLKNIQEALQTRQLQLYEQRLLVNDTLHYEEVRVIPCGEDDVLVMVRDISDRKRAEVALRESESTNRALIQTIPDMLIRMKRDGTYLSIHNGGNINCVNPSQAVANSDVYTILSTELADQRMEFTQKALETRQLQQYEQQLLIDDVLHYEEVRVIPCGEDDVLVMVRDISDRKRAEIQIRQQAQELAQTLQELKLTQAQMVQSEKMSGLGQMVAGVAHEINNPISFIYGNINYADRYMRDLLDLINLYQQHYPTPQPEIQTKIEAIDLKFVTEDLHKLLKSMQVGSERIREIVRSLRYFARLDEADFKSVNIHEGIDSTLMILHNRWRETPDRPEIEIVKQYGDIPYIDCYPGPLNQMFMNILSNAIDALEESHRQCKSAQHINNLRRDNSYKVHSYPNNPSRSNLNAAINKFLQAETSRIQICTELVDSQHIAIRIADNGLGMSEEVRAKLFDAFFTTKAPGQGTGLGLSISYQIVVEKHGGKLDCYSTPGKGTEFVIELPIQQKPDEALPPSPISGERES